MTPVSIEFSSSDTDSVSLESRTCFWEPFVHSAMPYTTILNFQSGLHIIICGTVEEPGWTEDSLGPDWVIWA